MSRSTKLVAAGLAAALALAAAALAMAATRHDSHATFAGRAMMAGYGQGMMGGDYGPAGETGQSSAGSLTSVRDQVERWLESHGFNGYRVSEVMAFANNDYVAVRDTRGKPAFELLTEPGYGRLMEEPASMMWNTHYGMMRGADGTWAGSGMMGGGMMSRNWNGWSGGGRDQSKPLSARQSVRAADRWLAQTRPGERAERDAQAFPGYFTIDTTRRGKIAGMLSVNASTGAVWYHGWHGRFLSERDF